MTTRNREAGFSLIELLVSLAIFALAMGGLGILRQPMAIAPTLPPSSSARLGLFRNLEQPESPLRAIRIRKDPRTGRWWVGDGHNPVLTEPPPAQIDARRLVNLSLTPVDLVSPEQSSPEDRVAPGRGDGAHLP